MDPKWLSVAGLALDAGGIAILFFYQVDPNSEISREGHVTLVAPDKDEESIGKYRKFRRLTLIAMALLFIGFCLQAAGTALS